MTSMLKLTTIAAAAVLAGCASPSGKMDAETSAMLKQAPVIQVVGYYSGGANITTPRQAVGAGLVASATGSSEFPTGASLWQAYKLPDPAQDVGQRLAEKLKAEGALRNMRVEPKLLSRPFSEDPSHYRGKYPGALVLELSVDNHGASYGAMSWKTYTYYLAGRARLIRVSDGKVLWADSCNVHAFADDAAKRRLDVSEFESNNAARFKEVLNYTNERCSRILADKILARGF